MKVEGPPLKIVTMKLDECPLWLELRRDISLILEE